MRFRGKVDCRNCRFFKPINSMTGEELEKAYIYLAKYRPNEKLLGWCTLYNRPVTYYEGYCRGYEPIDNEIHMHKLTEYLGRR